MTPAARRRALDHLRAAHRCSERRACGLVINRKKIHGLYKAKNLAVGVDGRVRRMMPAFGPRSTITVRDRRRPKKSETPIRPDYRI